MWMTNNTSTDVSNPVVRVTPDEDEEEEGDIYDNDNQTQTQTQEPVIPTVQAPPIQPIPPVPPIVLQRREGNWRINIGPVDQLAVDLFRHTRSRGPVADVQPTTARPAEYKPVPKRK